MGAKDAVAQKAKRDILARAKGINKKVDKLWAVAAKSPVFCKETHKKVDGKKVTTRRSARLIGAHAYNIAVSGAAKAVAKEQLAECKLLGIPYESTTSAACLPGFTDGAKYMLEQFMAAYVQEGMFRSKRTLTAIKRHKRMNKEAVKLGFEETNEQIFSASGPAPMVTIVVPLKKKKKAAAGGDDEYVPPADDEVAAADAADEAEGAADDAEEDA